MRSHDHECITVRSNLPLVLVNVSVYTKLEMPGFAHTKDITGVLKFKMGHETLTVPHLGVICHPKANI